MFTDEQRKRMQANGTPDTTRDDNAAQTALFDAAIRNASLKVGDIVTLRSGERVVIIPTLCGNLEGRVIQAAGGLLRKDTRIEIDLSEVL